MLKLFAWSKDFNPKSQRNSNAQVQVKFFGLSQEYWSKNILFTIIGSLGSPICTDATTPKPRIDRTFGQYVRILLDMDLSQTIRYKLLVERKGYAFFIEVDYENLLDYCSNCKAISHYVEICKKLNLEEVAGQLQDSPKRNYQAKKPDKVFVHKKDDRLNQGKETSDDRQVNIEHEDRPVNLSLTPT